jgi:hypothetical protein
MSGILDMEDVVDQSRMRSLVAAYLYVMNFGLEQALVYMNNLKAHNNFNASRSNTSDIYEPKKY